MNGTASKSDREFMRRALRLARRGYGTTSPNPMVGAVLVKRGRIIGQGWHARAGGPHAEIEAIANARQRGENPAGATLYVTLEPCSTRGRTGPCTEAIMAAGIKRVVTGTTDPNPAHAGRAFRVLEKAGLAVTTAVLANEARRLNETFNHWIIHRTPLVTLKSAMTLDGKIATATGESKWITSETSRAYAMKLRQGADAILAGINTVLRDDPSLTFRPKAAKASSPARLRRIVLDSRARTPLEANVVADTAAHLTTIVVTPLAPKRRIESLRRRVNVWIAPVRNGGIDLAWVLNKLGAEEVTSLLVEGGGEVHASFLEARLVHRIAFFYAPKILGGKSAFKAVGGTGARRPDEVLSLSDVRWKRLGPDLLLTARID